jgi:hypothetical protein
LKNTNASVLYSKLSSRQIFTVHVNKNKFLNELERMFIYKFNLIEPTDDYLFAYEIDKDDQPEFVHDLFNLNRFAGVLITNPSGIFYFRTTLSQIDQLNLKINLFVFESQNLSLEKQFQYDLNIIFVKHNSNNLEIEYAFLDFNGQLFSKNISINSEIENIQVREIRYYENLSFTIRKIYQVFISNSTLSPQDPSLFYLSTNLDSSVTNLYIKLSMLTDFTPKIYLIELNICQFDYECKLAKFNVKLNFFSAYSLTFKNKRFRFIYLNFNQSQHSLINTKFELIDSTKSVLDLRKMVHSPELIDRGFKFAPRMSNSLVSVSNKASTFFLDQKSGLLFAREAIQVNKVFSFDIDLLNEENIILSTASISIEINQIPHQIVRNVQLNLNQLYDNSDLVELIIMKNLFKLDSAETNFDFNLTCLNIDQFECKRMFRYNPNSSDLMLRVNKVSIKNFLRLNEFRMNLSFFNVDSKLISSFLTLRIELNDTNSSHVNHLASSVVFLNSTVDLDEYEVASYALRSVNLLNGKQMTYTNPISESILRNIEPCELYELNFYPSNVTIYSHESIYQTVYATKYYESIIKSKHFLNYYNDKLQHENRFHLNMSRFESDQTIEKSRQVYLINRISLSEFGRNEFNFNYLRKFFKINADVLFFDTDYFSMFLANEEVVKFEDLFDSTVIDFVVNRFTIDLRTNKIIEVAEHEVNIN